MKRLATVKMMLTVDEGYKVLLDFDGHKTERGHAVIQVKDINDNVLDPNMLAPRLDPEVLNNLFNALERFGGDVVKAVSS